MRYAIRSASLALVPAMLLCWCVSTSAQIRFEDFSDTNYAQQHLRFNGAASLGTWNDKGVLRLTDGASNLEGSTVYFRNPTNAQAGKQPVTAGFSSWFQFQVHSPLWCCSPGDGLAFIIQNSNATDTTMCATGVGITALGAGGAPQCPNQTGALGYAGINNSLVIEFDISQNSWDPNGNHIAIQTCGPNFNTPVHEPGDYTIGNNNMVQSCLLNQSQQSIDTKIKNIGDNCSDGTCNDGDPHDVVVSYTPPAGNQPGALEIWVDPSFVFGTHDPIGMPTMSVPYNIVYDPNNNPSGLVLDQNGAAWVGFTASQPSASDRRNGVSPPSGGTTQDILGWEVTNHGVIKIQEVIQSGGAPTMFAFGEHQTTVTYPKDFQNNNNILMTVTATPIDRQQFYQTRLAGTMFANEQCIVYAGTGGGSPPTSTNGNCVVYSYTCQDQMGNQVICPTEPLCTDPQQTECIDVNTSFDTMDNVTATNADYLENDAIGSNNWLSIFTGFQSKPIDGTTSGGTRGFGAGGSKPGLVSKRKLTGNVGADIVATFRPGQP